MNIISFFFLLSIYLFSTEDDLDIDENVCFVFYHYQMLKNMLKY